MRKVFILFCVIGLICELMFTGLVKAHSEPGLSFKDVLIKNNKDLIQGSSNNDAARTRVPLNYGNFPLYFIPNLGQVQESVLFYARTGEYTLWMTREGLVFDSSIKDIKKDNEKPAAHGLQPPVFSIKRDVSRLVFLNSNPKNEVSSLNMSVYRVNYFIGNESSKWKRDIPTSKAILYKELWTNIDLKVYGVENQIEYDWIVKPGGRIEDIQFEYRNIKAVKRDRDGDLIVKTEFGELRNKKPTAYQIIDGKRVEVGIEFKKIAENGFGFHAGDFDRKNALIIDPVLSYSTYLGGSDWDVGYGIAVDASGCAYVTGKTFSNDFPTRNYYQGLM